MNVALIKNNIAENIIVVETLQWAQENVLGYDDIFDTQGIIIGVGWEKQGEIWVNPNAPPIPPIVYKSILTPLEFLNRFTDEEALTIIALSKTDPTVELWWIKYNKAQDIDLDDPQTIAGVTSLETAGILSPGRAAEILTKYPVGS
jgi:hypothetical protein